MIHLEFVAMITDHVVEPVSYWFWSSHHAIFHSIKISNIFWHRHRWIQTSFAALNIRLRKTNLSKQKKKRICHARSWCLSPSPGYSVRSPHVSWPCPWHGSRPCRRRWPHWLAHEWINEIPTVPTYYLAKPQPRERVWDNQRAKKTLLSLTLVRLCEMT